MAQGSLTNAIPRNVFGRPEDEITRDFALPAALPTAAAAARVRAAARQTDAGRSSRGSR